MANCLWCNQALATRSTAARFCRDAHRNAFHSALRRFGEREFEAGRVTIEQLRGAASGSVHGAREA